MVLASAVSPEDKLRQRISGITNLPTPPVVFTQITKIINNPNTSVKDIAAIMSEDSAMSAKVLRLSNSAFFGAKNEITNIKQAVLVLGLEAVKSLVLSSSVFDMFKSHKMDAEFQEKYWRHSLATAIAGRLIVKYHKSAKWLDPEIAFSAGLLHDIGKLIICCFMPDEHNRIMQHLVGKKSTDYQAEIQVTGFAHTLVGKVLAENWKLPSTIQDAIEFHHSPHLFREGDDPYSAVIHVADFLARKTFEQKVLDPEGWTHLLAEVSVDLSLTDEIIDAFCHQLLDEYSRSNTFMQMAMSA